MITATKLQKYSVLCKESAKQVVKKSFMSPLIVCLAIRSENRQAPFCMRERSLFYYIYVVMKRIALLHIDLETLLSNLYYHDAVGSGCECCCAAIGRCLAEQTTVNGVA